MATSDEKLFRVPVLDVLPNKVGALKVFSHWDRMLTNYLTAVESNRSTEDVSRQIHKCAIMGGYLSPDAFSFVEDVDVYDEAMVILRKHYQRKKYIIYARHTLATRIQLSSETISEFSQALRSLAKDCNFKAVSAEQHREKALRDAFITGLCSANIRQRLLEYDELSLEKAIQIADSLERAEKFSHSYQQSLPHQATVTSMDDKFSVNKEDQFSEFGSNSDQHVAAARSTYGTKVNRRRCYFCGRILALNRLKCPARNAECFNCGLRGHFATVCGKAKKSVATVNDLHLTSIIADIPTSLSRSTITAKIAENPLMALLDSGASQSYIKASVARSLGLTLYGPNTVIALASNESVAQTIGFVDAPLKIGTRVYDAMKFGVVENLCTDIILGQVILGKHQKVVFEFNGDLDSLYVGKEVCNLASAKVSEPLRIFRFVDDNCKPIAVRSRNYSSDYLKFIKDEIARLLREGIMERYTALDAYPLPRINNIINEVAKGEIYSTIDLRSAYHQIPISDVDRPYTGFEAAGSLYQFCRVPFGVTNGVALFQRYMDSFIERENLEGTLAYLDNVTILGDDQPQHDKRLKAFMNAAERQGLTLNKNKSVFSVTELKFLGHLVSHGKTRPYPDHLHPLINLKPPRNGSNLKRCLELFAYYSKWISKFSKKLKPLSTNTSFPLKGKALSSFNQLKADLLKACLWCIYEDEPFVIECDASKFAIAAILSQKERPVAFNSRTLGKSELRHPAVEKEAAAIVEAVRKWGYLLHGKRFKLITDQKALAYISRKNHKSKIKNTKLKLWKLELSIFDYEIVHRPGVENLAPDALSRICASNACCTMSLREVHTQLGHPGVRRLLHFIRSKSLPFSVDDVKRECANCQQCAQIKLKATTFDPADVYCSSFSSMVF
ncbi:uncharacterized protein LOC144424417 [Styela clava]